MNIKELFTTWGFKVDAAALDAADKKLSRVRARADAVGSATTSAIDAAQRKLARIELSAGNAGDAATSAFDRPRDALGKFVRYKDGIFAGGGKGILGDYHTSLNLIKESAVSARSAVLALSAAFTAGGLGLGAVFKIMGDYEQIEIAFETLIGDAQKAQQTLKDLQQFARETPFNFGDVAKLSKQLLAYNFQAEELIPTMKALGDIAAGVGKDKLPQLVLALGQVRSATKLRGSELRQFTEAGVPLIGELATTLKVSEAAVQGMVEAGKVGYDDVYKSLQRLTGEGGRLNNLMFKQSATLGGLFSNIVDTIQQLIVAVGKRGLLGRAKTFLQNILTMLETNREKILEGTHHAIELISIALEKIITIGRAAWQVFDGMAQAVGGSRKAIELLIKAMFIFISAKMLFLLGKMGLGIAGLAKAFIFLGNSALAAQIKAAAVVIAIGAAFAGVALIIEDIIAYFQGRKSVTGYILKDLGGLEGAFDKILTPLFNKLVSFGATVGKSIVDGIASLGNADWAKVGEVMMKTLELMLIASTIPLRIGLSIAYGIVQGLEKGILEHYPTLANMLGIVKQGDASKQSWGTGWASGLPGILKPETVGPASALPPIAPAAGPQINVQSTNNITVPPGTPPENVAPMVSDGIKRGLQGILRETQRATKPAVAY